MPTTMVAANVERLGPADNIRYGKLPIPVIGPTDVLVEVEAVTVNQVDTFIRAHGGSGAFRTPTPFPFVIGRDLVGTVADAGPGATGFAPGQRVWCNSLGHGGRQGSFSGFAAVPAGRLYHLPDAAAASNRGLAAGRLLTWIDQVMPLERAADTHRMVEEGLRRRVVLRP